MALPVTTGRFTISTATYARTALSRLAGRWWWLVVLPPCVFMIMSLSDKAYIFAALIWIFMLLPPAVMMAYYSYLLNPEAAKLALPHTVTVDDGGGLTIDFPVDEEEEEDAPRPAPVYIDNGEITDVRDSNGKLVITCRRKELRFVIIPVDAFPEGTVATALTAIVQGNQRL